MFSTNMLQNNHENVHFLPIKAKKMAILCFGQCQSQWSSFLDHKMIHVLPRPHFGTPCISFSTKTQIFWFNFQTWQKYSSIPTISSRSSISEQMRVKTETTFCQALNQINSRLKSIWFRLILKSKRPPTTHPKLF